MVSPLDRKAAKASAIEEMGSDANKPVVVVSIMIITQETAVARQQENCLRHHHPMHNMHVSPYFRQPD